MADDDVLAGKMFCPECGTQLVPDPDDPNVGSCNGCGFHGDPNAHIAAPDEAGEYDDDDLDPDQAHFPDAPDTGRAEYQSGPTYTDYVRSARGKSVDDLFAEAAARTKPPKPLKTETDLEEALGTASASALSTAGVCPFCGAEPDKITDGVCGECGATQPTGITAWVVADDAGKTYGACSELCGKVGAAQKDGKLLGKRPWTPPADTDEPKCFVCEEPLTEVAPSAAPTAPTQPQPGQPFVAPGAGPGGTTVVGNVAGRTPGDPAPYAVGDRVRMIDRPQNVGTVAKIDTDHLDLMGKELGRTTAVDMDSGGRGVAAIDRWELVPEEEDE